MCKNSCYVPHVLCTHVTVRQLAKETPLYKLDEEDRASLALDAIPEHAPQTKPHQLEVHIQHTPSQIHLADIQTPKIESMVPSTPIHIAEGRTLLSHGTDIRSSSISSMTPGSPYMSAHADHDHGMHHTRHYSSSYATSPMAMAITSEGHAHPHAHARATGIELPGIVRSTRTPIY